MMSRLLIRQDPTMAVTTEELKRREGVLVSPQTLILSRAPGLPAFC